MGEERPLASPCSGDGEDPAENVSLQYHPQSSVVAVALTACVRIFSFQIIPAQSTAAHVVGMASKYWARVWVVVSEQYVARFWLLQGVKLLDNGATLLL